MKYPRSMLTISNAVRSERGNARALGWLSIPILTAAGFWCTRGLLDIVGGSTGVVRIAMLPPWWILAALVVALGMAGAAAAHAGYDPDIVLPLFALRLLAVPYVPWLPDRLPALRAAAGPARGPLLLVGGRLVRAQVI